MNILTIGDIVGENGLKKLVDEIEKLRKEHQVDFLIVNGENSAGGMGISTKNFDTLVNTVKADVVTMGNHTWAKKDIFGFINDEKLIVPANYSDKVPGKGYNIYKVNGKNICVIELMGRTDMNVLTDNPFNKVERILDKIRGKVDIIFVEMHAEATAEKLAMAYYLDGKVQAVYGTHTHIQTADERILENGTAYISDIGMTGPKKSVIGMDVEASVKRFSTTLPERYKLATGECFLNGCLFKIDDNTNKVVEIKRIRVD